MRLGEFEGFAVCEKRIRLISTQQKQKLNETFWSSFNSFSHCNFFFIPTRLEFLFPFSHVDATMSGMILTGPSASLWGDFSCCRRLYCRLARRRVSMRLTRPGSSHEIHLQSYHWTRTTFYFSNVCKTQHNVLHELIPCDLKSHIVNKLALARSCPSNRRRTVSGRAQRRPLESRRCLSALSIAFRRSVWDVSPSIWGTFES